MGRKKKFVNKTEYPDYAIERFARCIFDDIRAAYADEDIQMEFAIWQAEQAAKKLHMKKRAANTAALFILFPFILSWPSRFGFGAHLPTIRKIGMLIPCEINK